jgi:hypothetical protein
MNKYVMWRGLESAISSGKFEQSRSDVFYAFYCLMSTSVLCDLGLVQSLGDSYCSLVVWIGIFAFCLFATFGTPPVLLVRYVACT